MGSSHHPSLLFTSNPSRGRPQQQQQQRPKLCFPTASTWHHPHPKTHTQPPPSTSSTPVTTPMLECCSIQSRNRGAHIQIQCLFWILARADGWRTKKRGGKREVAAEKRQRYGVDHSMPWYKKVGRVNTSLQMAHQSKDSLCTHFKKKQIYELEHTQYPQTSLTGTTTLPTTPARTRG